MAYFVYRKIETLHQLLVKQHFLLESNRLRTGSGTRDAVLLNLQSSSCVVTREAAREAGAAQEAQLAPTAQPQPPAAQA